MKKSEFAAELKGMSLVDLKERARQVAEELMKLRFRKAVGQLEQTHHLGELKKNLARVNTAISQQSGQEAGAEG